MTNFLRQSLLPALLSIAGPLLAQQVEISGTAMEKGRVHSSVQVVVNDTLHKLSASTLEKSRAYYLSYLQLSNDSNYVFRVKDGGRFRIRARPTDSLVFTGNHVIRQTHKVADLRKRPVINILLQPAPCLPYVPCRDTVGQHYVFIGEKIRVAVVGQPYYCNLISMDGKFQADYKVLDNIYGHLPQNTVRFSAYDHYGTPAFSETQVALLFLSEYCHELIHQKYLYFPLYKTADNKWAAPYPATEFARLPAKATLKPHRIKFNKPVATNIAGADPAWVAQNFPAPYYRIEADKAIAQYGCYVNELVELEKQTVLKARGVILK